MAEWNPWHGCTKLSAGCLNCYVYRRDASFGKDSSAVVKTSAFDLPIRKNRSGGYKLSPDGGYVYTCFTSDFFHPAADGWRPEAWRMIRARSDLSFFIVTKRIDRFAGCVPDDWGGGYENVTLCCTVENQDRAEFRLPIFLAAPIRHKQIICEPILEAIDLSEWFCPQIERVTVGGESGPNARLCDYSWVLSIREQCAEKNIPFHFKQTGANIKKDGRIYTVERKFQLSQARKAGIDLD